MEEMGRRAILLSVCPGLGFKGNREPLKVLEQESDMDRFAF